MPPDDFAPGGAPLPLPIQRERHEQPIVHPKINDAPSPALRPPSSSAPTYNYPTSRYSPEEQHPSNGWTTAILSPSPGAESVGEDVTCQSPPSVKGNVSATTHFSTDSPPDPEPRGTGGDRAMSIGTLLSSHEHPNPSYGRRGAGAYGMDVDGEGQARRRRKYDER